MDELNKYSAKLINNLTKYKSEIDSKTSFDYDTHPIITKLIEQYNSTSLIPLRMIDEYTLPKLHDITDPPLVYLLWKKIYDNDLMHLFFDYVPDISDFSTFIEWYRSHQTTHNLDDVEKRVESKIKDFVSICNPKGIRERLHDSLYKNNFVSLDILQHAETETLNYQEYKGENISIHLFTIKDGDVPDLNLITKIISYMWLISKKTINVDLTIFYGKQKKYITHKHIMCSDNINSGSTYPGSSITIWRLEEFYKVLIHEMVHYVGFDTGINKSVLDILSKYISVDEITKYDSPRESYTETIAITLHTIIMSQILNRSFTELFKYELCHSMFQVGKIINFFGGHTCDQLFKSHPKHITIKQTTSVASYFIIKLFNLLSILDFYDMWEKYGLYINSKTYETYVALYKKTMHSLDDIKYVNLINKMIDQIKDKKCDKFIYLTMRMTCIQQFTSF